MIGIGAILIPAFFYFQFFAIKDEVGNLDVKKEDSGSETETVEEIQSFDVPEVVKAVYLTSASAGSTQKIDSVINLIKKTELNAIVIDIKDSVGRIGYDTSFEDAEKYGAERDDISEIKTLMDKLHENNIYIIG